VSLDQGVGMAEFGDELPLPSFNELCASLVINKVNGKRVQGKTTSSQLVSKAGKKKKENEQSPHKNKLPDTDKSEDHELDDYTPVTPANSDETTGRWTAEEHKLFLEGIKRFGKDWRKMQPLIKTRSLIQIRTHAQKVFKKIRHKSDGMSAIGNHTANSSANSIQNRAVSSVTSPVASPVVHSGGAAMSPTIPA
jgi:SHAQKYF class myb-like DNA-binding protein